MEQNSEDQYEALFVEIYKRNREVVIPLLEVETFVERIDRTAEYVWGIIKKYYLEKLDGDETVGNVRYTNEHGEHYWIRAYSK